MQAVRQQHDTWPALPTQPAAKSSGSQMYQGKLVIDNKKQNVSTVALEVHRTISDLTRRKCNIIVTGIPENDNADNNNADETAFLKLCEENLSLKPSLSRLGCRRLGRQSSGGRPRKLLVHLTSEETAKDLLKEAPKLRNLPDTACVYINPDLSPAEAALAYQRRQRRRQATANRTDGNTSATQQVSQGTVIHRTDDSTLQTVTQQPLYNPTLDLSAMKTTVSSPTGSPTPFPAV